MGAYNTEDRLALAQINPTVGDVDANTSKIEEWVGVAREAGLELVIFPELCIPGYPAEDLYLKPHFIAANTAAVQRLASDCEGIASSSASPSRARAPTARSRSSTTRSPLLARRPPIAGRLPQAADLPNYGVFDEQRYFAPGPSR